jgi:hypothetical protein
MVEVPVVIPQQHLSLWTAVGKQHRRPPLARFQVARQKELVVEPEPVFCGQDNVRWYYLFVKWKI